MRVRLIVAVLLALLALWGIVYATGGATTVSIEPTAGPAPAPTPGVTPSPTTIQYSGEVQGRVVVVSAHRGNRWTFTYTLSNTGRVPIGGFELSAPPSNLFRIRNPTGWSFYGSGVCRQNHPGVLIYWSTSSAAGHEIKPGQSGHFSFQVNTAGTTVVHWSSSWNNARPLFGSVTGPQPSGLPALTRCG